MAKKIVTWILVADGARARLFVNEGVGKGLEAVRKGEYEGERAPSRELVTDRPGRTFDSGGSGRHAKEPTSDPHRQAKRSFAHEIAQVLRHAAEKGEFDRLVIVAPPKALGDLRNELPQPARERIHAEVHKDLTHLSIHELPPHLENVLAL